MRTRDKNDNSKFKSMQSALFAAGCYVPGPILYPSREDWQIGPGAPPTFIMKKTINQNENKTSQVNFRLKPSIRKMLRELAEHGERSVGFETERIIKKEFQAVFGREPFPTG